MSGRGGGMQTREAVRALLAERQRAAGAKGSADDVHDQKTRIQQMLEQRRRGVPAARPASHSTPKPRGRDAEFLSPDSSMSFEFDQPQDACSPSHPHSQPATAERNKQLPRSRSEATAFSNRLAAASHAHRPVSVSAPNESSRPDAGPTAPGHLTRSHQHASHPGDIAKHLSPKQQAAWVEIQNAIDPASLPSPQHSHFVPTTTARQHAHHHTGSPSHAPPYSAQQPAMQHNLPSTASPHHASSSPDRPTQINAPQPAAASQQAATARPTLAELEQRLAQVWGGMPSLHVGPEGHAVSGGSGGPFDISDLWLGQGSASRTQSEQSTAHTDTHGEEVQSQRQPGAGHPQHQQPGGRAGQRQHRVGTGGVGRPVSARPATNRNLFGSDAMPQEATAHTAAQRTIGAGALARPGPAAPRRSSGGGHKRSQSAPRSRGVSEPLGASMAAQTSLLLVSNPKEFTFKPKINERSREMVRDKYPVDRDDRFEQLAVPKTVLLQKYEHARQEEEQAELAECTFKPRTGRPPSPAKVQHRGPVYERLYAQQPSWLQRRQQLLEEREQEKLADCTFRPQVSVVSQRRAASAGRAPLHMRVQEVLRSKNESLTNARIRREMADEGVTFQPNINRRSMQLVAKVQAAQGTQGMTAGERMYQEAMAAKLSPRARNSPEEAQCTFAPYINERSRQMVAHSQELPSGFLERQEFLAALAAEKRALFAGQVEEAEKRPHRYGSSRRRRDGGLLSSATTSGSWGGSDELLGSEGAGAGDRIAKLAYADVRRSAALKDALTKHYYGQYTFTPEINPRSRVIGKSHTVDDLYRNERPMGRHAKQLVAKSVEQQELAECTFQPALNPHSLQTASMRRSGSLLDGVNTQQMLQERAAKLQEQRALREFEQMKECTFTPEVNRGTPATKKKVDLTNVPGVAAFLDNQDLAKRRAEEEKRRQDEVWWQKPRGNHQLFTVPQPFSFEERLHQRQLAEEAALYLEQEAAAVVTREHTLPSQEVSLRKQARPSPHAVAVSKVLQQAEALQAALGPAGAGSLGGDRTAQHITLRLQAR